LGHNLLSRAFRWESLWRWDFRFSRSLWLSRSLLTNSSSFHNRILAIMKPSTWNFSFFTMNSFLFWRWNSGYPGAFLANFLFFHDGIMAIREPFSWTFSFFHDGILAIREPFSPTFSFLTMEFWLSGSLSHELFLFSR
jgi:hypothetical protein